jgi:hypothetical protein
MHSNGIWFYFHKTTKGWCLHRRGLKLNFNTLLCIGLYILSTPAWSQPHPAPPQIELDTTLFKLSDEIFFNQDVKGHHVRRHAKVVTDFSEVIQEFLSMSHLSELLHTARRKHSRGLEFSDMTIYFSIYEIEDPGIYRAFITAMKSGVNVVVITDRQNALPFRPASKKAMRQWNEYQERFYMSRYDKNGDGIVDNKDKTDIDYRTRLMKQLIKRLKREFRRHQRENTKHNRFPDQDLRVVTSPYKYVPPEGTLYLPLHHSKLLMITVRQSGEDLPLEALVSTGNATFSGMRGDLKPDVHSILAESEFLKHGIGAEDFIPASRGNVNLMVKISNFEILKFLLEKDILDSIQNYENGRMFSETMDPEDPPYRDFVLRDESRIRVGVTRGRPGRGTFGETTSGYDPNGWIVDFLRDDNQSIHRIDEIVSTEFVYSHLGVHRELQRVIKRDAPKVTGLYDHSFAFQPYSKVLGLAGVTRLTEPRGESARSSKSRAGTSQPSDALDRSVYIIDSPYGMLLDTQSDLRVFSRPWDKMHLKMMMVQYQHQDAELPKPQTRYRVFWGSLNRTANGPNNRELFFSIDTADPFLYKTLRQYVDGVAKSPHAIPLKEEYARNIVRSLFRLPRVMAPQAEDTKPDWEAELTTRRIKRIVNAIHAEDPNRRASRLDRVLRELSKALAPHSAFAESTEFKNALKLIALFFNDSDARRQHPKNLWMAFDFISKIHTDAINETSLKKIADHFFGTRAEPRKAFRQLIGPLTIGHDAIGNAIYRAGFIPTHVATHEYDGRLQLMPNDEFDAHVKNLREVVRHAYLKPDADQLHTTLLKAVTAKKHSYLARLITLAQNLPKTVNKPQLIRELIHIFNEPGVLASASETTSALTKLSKKHDIAASHRKQMETVFRAYRKAAQKEGLSLPHYHCS